MRHIINQIIFLLVLSISLFAETMQKTKITCGSDNREARKCFRSGNEGLSIGKYNSAVKFYIKAIELDSNFCDAYDNLGYIYRRYGKIEEALRIYIKSLEINSVNIVALQNSALCWALLGVPEKAVENYTKVVELSPADPEGYYGLGMVLPELGEYNLALENTLNAIRLYNLHYSLIGKEVYFLLGINYFHVENYQMANKYLRKVYIKFRKDPQMNYFYGITFLHITKPNYRKANKYIGKAEKLGVDIPSEIKTKLIK